MHSSQYVAVIAAHHPQPTRRVMKAVCSELEDYSPESMDSADGLFVWEPEPPPLWDESADLDDDDDEDDEDDEQP